MVSADSFQVFRKIWEERGGGQELKKAGRQEQRWDSPLEVGCSHVKT